METSIEDCASEVIDMSRKSESVLFPLNLYMAIFGLTVFGMSCVAIADPNPGNTGAAESRSSISSHSIRGGGDNSAETRVTTEDYGALVTTGTRNKSDTRGGFAKLGDGSGAAESAGRDPSAGAWIRCALTVSA